MCQCATKPGKRNHEIPRRHGNNISKDFKTNWQEMGAEDDEEISKSDIKRVKYSLILDGNSHGSLRDLSITQSENQLFTLWDARQRLMLRKDTTGAGKFLFVDFDDQPIPRRLERELGLNDFAKRNKTCLEKLLNPCKRILKIKRASSLELCHISFFHGCFIAGSPALKYCSDQFGDSDDEH